MDFLSAHDAQAEAHAFDSLARAEREQASRQIADQVTRQIAMLFRDQEAHEEHQGHLRALHTMALEFPPEKVLPMLSPKAQAAYLRARQQGNYSALDALDRELNNQRDEEEQAVALLLAH